jgi:ribosomal protein L37AE/L43A
MQLLVAGIYECPKCKKILKEKPEKEKESIKIETEDMDIKDGDYFHNNLGLNKQYEVCEKGIIVSKTPNHTLAVLVCHTPLLKDEIYVRLSWWKGFQHAGMLKVYDTDELNNLISAFKVIDENFDDEWNWKGKYGKREAKTDEQLQKEKNLDIIKYRIIENRTCPKCQKKMDKMKSHYECQHCGEIVILEGYNQPIFNIPSKELDLRFQSNFPINFYLPVSGITIKWLMGEWKALVVIYSKDNPNKKWLRFYWWVRDLSNILKYGQREIGEGTQMGWKAQKGVASPNIFDKKLITPFIDALNKTSQLLNWD